uniref:CSON013086 protein n=1 Tax=Culicoides sonorensis TaxID=179676 RepID=A0A336MB97_CULSO
MNLKSELLKLLPSEQQLFDQISKSIGSDKILHQIYEKIIKTTNTEDNNKISLEFLDVIIDYLHESLHIGEWYAVDIKLRKSFSLASLLKVLCLLKNNDENTSEVLGECAYLLDMAIMLGDTITSKINGDKIQVLPKAARLISNCLEEVKSESEPSKKRIKIDMDYDENVKCDIPVYDKPSLELFIKNHYTLQKPVLLRNTINHWPALEKWKDLNYLISNASGRTVPVELGSQYTSENWSQSLMKFDDFIVNHVIPDPNSIQDKVYLAQHDLFDQIPELKDDISVPEYISDPSPRIKAWLGPQGTVSPLHTDPTHNLLCQVLGKKNVILASPDDTNNLYAHDHFILNNTSQVDVENIDFEKFPLCKDVKFYHILLQQGDVLYIPPKWWHHIRSLSPSFSISYWFD